MANRKSLSQWSALRIIGSCFPLIIIPVDWRLLEIGCKGTKNIWNVQVFKQKKCLETKKERFRALFL